MKMPTNQAAIWSQVPRALRQAGNSLILDRLRLAQATVELLEHEGHMVVDLLIAGEIVTATIAASSRLADLVAQGRGFYYLSGIDQSGLYFRRGLLFGYRNVSVIWTERGN